MAIEAVVFDAYGTLFDVQSVATLTEEAFPGQGGLITQIWRMKQLEYSWLRSMMGEYEDFWSVTRAALGYTLGALGLAADAVLLERIAHSYNTLSPYPDAGACLAALGGRRAAILSNGSPAMLAALVAHAGFADLIPEVLSIDAARAYKPDPRAYALVEARLGVPPARVLFVTSNGFDVAGAKRFGFTVARIERQAPAALAAELAAGPVGPATMYRALRTRVEAIGAPPDFTIAALAELPSLLSGREWA
ncbi:MAG: haloacid dehalogenase type II [Rhodospirillales bacterium]|nr:haloacid dehalogenase type II [Rhodospirillales bacterium]